MNRFFHFDGIVVQLYNFVNVVYTVVMFKARRLAIDLGTANSVIQILGQEAVRQEPTVVALDKKTNKIRALGAAAKQMIGRVPNEVTAYRPLEHGAITHYKATAALLKDFLVKATASQWLPIKPEVIISTPAGLTSVEERAVIRAAHEAGAGKVYLLPEPVAAALGAGLPVQTSAANMIVNLGGGTAEIAIISLGGIIAHASHRGAGDALNKAICEHLKSQKGIIIPINTAEVLKIKLANISRPSGQSTIVHGADSKTGQPVSLEIYDTDLIEPLKTVMRDIVNVLSGLLSKLPAELVSDLVERGVAMSGGTAQLAGLDQFFTKALNLPFYVVDEPILCVSRGLKYALEHLDEISGVVRS